MSDTKILTATERDILILKANGYTTAQASVELGIRTSFIDTAMTNIFNRLGAHNCPHAIAISLKLDELTTDQVEMTVIDTETGTP